MVQVRQRVLAGLIASVLLAAPAAEARKFYDDDPLWNEPRPLPVGHAKKRKLNEYYDFFKNTLFEPGEKVREAGAVPRARAVNTLGEVPNTGWYQNRDVERMSLDELVRGPGNSNAPSMDGPWTVIGGKSEGITPGLTIKDRQGRTYLLKFDPKSNPDMASAADVIGSKFFHAFGYYAPENYIVRFTRQQLRVGPDARFVDRRSKERNMSDGDVDDVLLRVPRDKENRYRALASLMIAGDLIGPFRFHDVRTDDPNDVVPHENRRDLRGLFVFSAWMNHTDSKALNTLDTIIEENGLRYIRHYLIDFGAILGSDSFEAKSPRAGNEYLFDFKPAAVQFLTLGLYVPEWQRADYPKIPSVGRFESEVFDPEEWHSNYPNPAFDNRKPDDTFWAARKVMMFTDQQIRALVETGEYSDPRAVDWVTRNLIVRRDKIGRAFFNDVLPLDRFAVRGGKLQFEDLAVKYGFASPRQFQVTWTRFDNGQEKKVSTLGQNTFEIPAALKTPGTYVAADIRGDDPAKTVTVYIRNRQGRIEVVGIDRAW